MPFVIRGTDRFGRDFEHHVYNAPSWMTGCPKQPYELSRIPEPQIVLPKKQTKRKRAAVLRDQETGRTIPEIESLIAGIQIDLSANPAIADALQYIIAFYSRKLDSLKAKESKSSHRREQV